MDVHDKVNFAQALFRNDRDLKKRNDPDSVPASLIKLYDESCELNNWLCRSGKHIDPRTLWVVAKMDQIMDDLRALTDRMQAIEAQAQNDGAPVVKAEPKAKINPSKKMASAALEASMAGAS